MNVIKMEGRMGNQMFQYALYCALNMSGRPTVIDDVYVRSKGVTAREIFHLKYKTVNPAIRWISRSKNELVVKIRRIFRQDYEEKSENFIPGVLEMRSSCLKGFWQSEKYFADPKVQEKLRKDFDCLQECLSGEAFRRYYEQIVAVPSVSVHFRRTDYFEGKNEEIYTGICTDDYYREAIRRVRESCPEAVFFLFSDDKEYIRELAAEDPAFVLVDDPGLRDIDEFFLMRYCRHHILANSSFSWWAAWLDDREETMVLAPDEWERGRDKTDIYTDRMIRIPSGERD